MARKALVVISFGSTYDDSRVKDIGGIEQALAAAFPAYDQFRAFTSSIIRRRLAERGIIVQAPEEILQLLQERGYEDVVMQPTHLLHGEEYEQKILVLKKKYEKVFKSIILSKPLIVDDADYRLLAAALATQMPQLAIDEGYIFMGHGSPRDNNRSYGLTYVKMQAVFDKMHLPVLVGTVENEDMPNFERVLVGVQERGYKKIHLAPLMVVAGEHANNDMAGDADSWKSQIEKLGINVECQLSGIGRCKAVQALYVRHMLQALAAAALA